MCYLPHHSQAREECVARGYFKRRKFNLEPSACTFNFLPLFTKENSTTNTVEIRSVQPVDISKIDLEAPCHNIYH
jgi:hypothetical protein